MPLVFAAIVPHPPLLIPSIGKDRVKTLNVTRHGFGLLESHLYAAKPDVIIVLSPHGQTSPSSWQITIGDELIGNFEEFSDFSTTIKLRGAVGLSHKIKERAEDANFPVSLQSERPIDYGISIPLLFLAAHLESARIIPITMAASDLPAHYDFGRILREELFATNERIAVLASADLSHREQQSHKTGRKTIDAFDQHILEAVKTGRADALLSLHQHEIDEAVVCGIRPICTLLGVLHGRTYSAEIISYERPFGTGYGIIEFHFH